jgi:hypothetical protein
VLDDAGWDVDDVVGVQFEEADFGGAQAAADSQAGAVAEGRCFAADDGDLRQAMSGG